MLMFDPSKGASFVRKAFTGSLAWLGAVQAADWLWERFGITSPALVWAYTVATFAFVIYLAMFICFSRQIVYKQRLDQCADAKRKLEEQVLKNRQSSTKKK